MKPILEVLVGKTVEQSLLEVMEEEELANLRAQQVQDSTQNFLSMLHAAHVTVCWELKKKVVHSG